MDLISNWKLTHGTTVLVNYGDLLADELPFDQGNATFVDPSPDSPYPLVTSGGNSATSFGIAVFKDYATDKEAAAGVLNGLIFTQNSAVEILKIERKGWTDGRYWKFEMCRISAARPRMMQAGDAFRIRREYTLTCAGLSFVAGV